MIPTENDVCRSWSLCIRCISFRYVLKHIFASLSIIKKGIHFWGEQRHVSVRKSISMIYDSFTGTQKRIQIHYGLLMEGHFQLFYIHFTTLNFSHFATVQCIFNDNILDYSNIALFFIGCDGRNYNFFNMLNFF